MTSTAWRPSYSSITMAKQNTIEDVYIAVMGVTGAGKSSFIATSSGQPVKVGHDLVSCTTDVEDVAFMYNDRLRIHLLDTPGFDDTNKSDVEVLQNISLWLANSLKNGIKLKGIIFLHRISDRRLAGSARRNLGMFKKLCGARAFQSIILATTMWSNVDPAEGAERERQLKDNPEFWGTMCKRGSTVMRYHNSQTSAYGIIDYILSQNPDPVVLEIQDEIVNRGMAVDQTSAAEALNAEIVRERKRHQEELAEMKRQMEEAFKQRDKELQEDFQEEINALQAKIEKGVAEQGKLAQSLEEVQRRKQAEFEAFKVQIQREREETRRRHEHDLAQQRRTADEQTNALKREYEVRFTALAQDRAALDDVKRNYEEAMDRQLRENEAKQREIEAAKDMQYQQLQAQLEQREVSVRGALFGVATAVVSKVIGTRPARQRLRWHGLPRAY
ncbi:P-loop containing nucleoside triphosphate hydrolase protein [Apiosordaria backusii]|uniref:P-loop containing nucleoside triphosphate hydrolase protein n=1 Tax=Apiosordaria backusii TaxID=314023 RepID=A0AA40ANB5_9PEZI|nr:P-loop containing nucleoside triphosphate hydrolase protein [Apiosordaria backusii]